LIKKNQFNINLISGNVDLLFRPVSFTDYFLPQKYRRHSLKTNSYKEGTHAIQRYGESSAFYDHPFPPLSGKLQLLFRPESRPPDVRTADGAAPPLYQQNHPGIEFGKNQYHLSRR